MIHARRKTPRDFLGNEMVPSALIHSWRDGRVVYGAVHFSHFFPVVDVLLDCFELHVLIMAVNVASEGIESDASYP